MAKSRITQTTPSDGPGSDSSFFTPIILTIFQRDHPKNLMSR